MTMLRQMGRSLAAERSTARAEAQAEIKRLRLIVQKLQRNRFDRRAEQLDGDRCGSVLKDLEADLARAGDVALAPCPTGPSYPLFSEKPR